MSPITSHVLDTTLGKPAHGLAVVLEIRDGPDRWSELARATTDAAGRIAAFDPPLKSLNRQVYRLRFVNGGLLRSDARAHVLSGSPRRRRDRRPVPALSHSAAAGPVRL